MELESSSSKKYIHFNIIKPYKEPIENVYNFLNPQYFKVNSAVGLLFQKSNLIKRFLNH